MIIFLFTKMIISHIWIMLTTYNLILLKTKKKLENIQLKLQLNAFRKLLKYLIMILTTINAKYMNLKLVCQKMNPYNYCLLGTIIMDITKQ